MADLKISALNSLAGADLVAADVVAVVDDSASETKKLTVSDLIANGVTLISNSTIPSAKILFSAGAIDTAELAASSVETAKINDSAVTAAKLADNSSVTLVSTLPASGDFTGQIALDTDDDKIYIWDGSAWDSVKGAGSINVVNGSTTGEVNIVTSTSGDTVTVSATLDDTTAAAQFLAGPTGAGGTVGYRAIIGTDLPTATTTAKGGVIVNGNGLTMSSDTIAIDNTVTAETSENHIVQYDANGLITGGRAIVAADVPNATSTTVGVIKPGSGLGVTGAGELNHDNSVTAGTASKVTFDTEGHITGTESLIAADIPDLDASKITTGTVPTARIGADAVTAEKLADRSTATIAETTPAGGAFIGQTHLNSITGDYFLWDGNVWQPIGISVGEIILAGTYDASTNLMATVTSEGTALSFVVGSALPAASSANKGYYVVVSEAGTGTSPAPTVALNPPDFLLSTGTAYTEIDVSSTVTAQQASNVAFTAAGNIAATNVQAAIEELDTEKVGAASPTFTGTVALGEDAVITFEGATDNAFETTLTVVDPTADRSLSLPNVSGTLVSSGDTGTVTSTMILDGTIANADISASAEIAVSKLANGTARQLLQTDAAGTGVEFTSNVDVPGTLDVTGAATLDSTLDVTGVISADGKVKFPAGSASAPSFYSGTDTNTGLYFSAADEVSITTGGTQRIAIDSSGRLIIGASSARVVGTTRQFTIEGTDSPTSSASIFRNSNNTSGAVLALGKSRGTSNGSNTVLQSGDQAGAIFFYGADGTDAASQVASISAEIDGTPGSNDMPGRLVFNTTADGASSVTERLRIDSSGRVGIGTTSPAHKLDITGPGTANASTLRINDAASSADSRHIHLTRSSANAYIGVAGTQAGDPLFISRTGQNSDLVINSAGKVGIGTTSPDQLLTVNGGVGINNTGANGGAPILTITNNSGNPFINFTSNSTALTFGYNSTERMRIDTSGRLLVGSTSNHGDEKLLIQGSASGSTGNSILTLRRGSDAGNGDGLGQVNFADTRTSSLYAQIFGVADAAPGANDFPGRLVISTTADGAASPTERLRIDSSGHVQIGSTTSDSFRLKVLNGAGTLARFTDGTSQTLDIRQASGGIELQNPNNGFISFKGSSTERMRIDSSGRLLVGATSGSYDFEVKKSGHIHGLIGSTNAAGATLLLDGDSNGDGSGSDYASISHNSDGALIFENRKSASIIFRNTSSSTERMRITSAGVVTVKNGAVAEIDTLTSASTVTPDFAASCNFTLTLGTNVTLANPSNVTAGQSGSIFLVQDGTGSRTLTLGSNYDFAGGTAPTLSTAANAVDRLDYIVRTSTSIHCVVTALYS